jgi:hypothetical protein
MTSFEEQVIDVEIAMAVRTTWLAKRAKFREKNSGTANIFTEKLPADVQELIDGELKSKHKMRDRSPEDWLLQIEELPEPVRTRAAWIIWWDFFAHRPVVDRWPHLDHFINKKCEPVTDGDLAMALHNLGYTPYMAVARVKGGDEPTEEDNETQADPLEDQVLVTA